MSLSTSIAAGTLLGAVAAFAVYTATAPGEDAVVAPVAAGVAPRPTPSVGARGDRGEPPDRRRVAGGAQAERAYLDALDGERV